MEEKIFAALKQLYGQEFIQEIIDDLLDKVEAKAATTSTPVDDWVVESIRRLSGIPDDIGGDED